MELLTLNVQRNKYINSCFYYLPMKKRGDFGDMFCSILATSYDKKLGKDLKSFGRALRNE